MRPLVTVALAAWIPATMILFRVLGPRRAALIGLFGGFILLPRDEITIGIFHLKKGSIAGLGLLAGVLVSDPKALIRARPRWVDLPMIAFVALPIASFAANGFVGWDYSSDLIAQHLASWGLPYLIGRLYFGDREGPRRVTVALIAAGLLSLPIFAFEMVAGPRYYLAGLIFGIPYEANMVSRLGGWRPEGFLSNGIEVSNWLALSATVATWAWLRGAWRPGVIPAWFPPLILSAFTIACRGVYGYANLAVGLGVAVATHFLGTRAFLILLAILPPLYVAGRSTGLWDGQVLVRMAATTGRADTVAYRIGAEDAYASKVREHDAALGFGGHNFGIFDFWAKSYLWADGWWVHEFRTGGYIGVSAFLLALFLWPGALAIALPIGRGRGGSPGSMARGLGLFVLLHALDSLHNWDQLIATPLIGGSIVGLFACRDLARPAENDPDASKAPPPEPSRIAAMSATIGFLVILEVLGRMPRSQPSTMVPPPAGEPSKR